MLKLLAWFSLCFYTRQQSN